MSTSFCLQRLTRATYDPSSQPSDGVDEGRPPTNPDTPILRIPQYTRPSLYLWAILLMKVKVSVTQSCPTLCHPIDCSPPGSFPRQEYWSGAIPFSRGCFPTQGSNLGLPPLQADSLPSEPWKLKYYLWLYPNLACGSKRLLNKMYIQRFLPHFSHARLMLKKFHHVLQYQLIWKKTELIQHNLKMIYQFISYRYITSRKILK